MPIGESDFHFIEYLLDLSIKTIEELETVYKNQFSKRKLNVLLVILWYESDSLVWFCKLEFFVQQ